MKFQVAVRVFNVGKYALKKGDIFEIVSSYPKNGVVVINSTYFEEPVEISMQEIEIHCEKI